MWKTYSFNLTKGDMKEIEAYHPDIILLTGGTDGGNAECILYNARMLSELSYDCPIVLAGNAARQMNVPRSLGIEVFLSVKM